MKKLLLILLCLPMIGFGQRKYSPEQDINLNLTITIKEPYKPIDYAKINKNFTDALQAEVQRREALKRHYDDLAMQTKSSILSNSYLTSDNNINSLILKLQNNVLEHIDNLNNYLKRGLIKPTKYEQYVRNGYYNYINTNQTLLYILQYKYNKITSLNDQNLIIEYEDVYNNTLKSIDKFTFNEDDNCIYFYLDELLYKGKKMHKSESLYDFISTSCEGDYEKYKNAVNVEKERQAKVRASKEALENELIIKRQKLHKEMSISRNDYISTLSKKEFSKFLKSEFKYLIQPNVWDCTGLDKSKIKKSVRKAQEESFELCYDFYKLLEIISHLKLYKSK